MVLLRNVLHRRLGALHADRRAPLVDQNVENQTRLWFAPLGRCEVAAHTPDSVAHTASKVFAVRLRELPLLDPVLRHLEKRALDVQLLEGKVLMERPQAQEHRGVVLVVTAF